MRHTKVGLNPGSIVSAALWLLILAIILPLEQAAGSYEVNWYTIDGGGGTSSGGPYMVIGTLGQPDAGAMSGGDYELLGGFWPGRPLCIVEFEDFARFAEDWLRSGGDLLGDLDGNSYVDYTDLRLLADEWLNSCPSYWPLR